MYEFSPGTSSTSFEASLEPNRLSLDVSRQSKWILKQHCNADFEVYAKEFDILRTSLNTWKHLCLMMVTKPRVKRCRQYLQCNHPKGVITRHFHAWHKTNVTAGQDGMIACHPHLNGGVWSDQSNQRKGTKEVP